MIKEKTLQRIQDKSAIVGVIGLGYVGLPFMVEKAKVGYKVIGVDRNQSRVEKINCGKNYILDVCDAELKQLIVEGLIEADSDFKRVPEMDVVVIAVPTPLTKNLTPDLTYIENVSHELAKYLRPGQLVSLESTTYPGTTEEVMLPILQQNGLKVEQDFFLSHSPERVDPGNKRYTTKNTNKVVGGVGPNSLEVAMQFYSQTIENVVAVSSAKIAELTKVFENTFRAVNIALVNEMTLMCDRMGINVWEVLDAAFTKPFGIMPFYPGPGIGGHCIPLDPHYLEWKAREFNFNTHFIALAGELNRKMPEFVLEKTLRILNQLHVVPAKAKILIWGVAYKRNISDIRESPALRIIKLLQSHQMNVCYHDPYVPELAEEGIKMVNEELSADLVKNCDLVIIATDHSDFDYNWLVEHAKHIFDTRNATKNINNNRNKITLL